MALKTALDLTDREADALFGKTEQDMLGVAVGELERLEVRRRIAETRLSLFFRSTTANEFMEDAWSALESMGYSNAEREASTLFYWATYLLNSGAPGDEIRTVVERFRRVIEGSMEGENASMARHFRGVLHRLEARADMH